MGPCSPAAVQPRALTLSNQSNRSSWRAPTPLLARIGTMNRKRSVVGQPSRLPSRASRPRRILGRDAPAAGGTPAPLPRGSWRESIGRCDCLGKHFAVQTRVRSGTQRIGLGILLCVLGALRVRVSTCFARSQPNLTWLQQVSELKASSLWRAS